MLIIQDLKTRRRYWRSQTTGPPGRYNFGPGLIIMKFGEQLRTSVIKEYQWSYIAYDELKALLKTDYVEAPTRANPKPKRKEWTESDEAAFINRMEDELDKVHTKQKLKAIDNSRRIAASEIEVQDVVARLNTNDKPSDEEFMMLEEDLSDTIADVHDLAKFVQLNYTGFQKIIKKHDKTTKWVLRPVFAARLKAKPFYKDNYDADIVKLSKLYDIVRTRGNPVQGDSAAGGSQGSFIRNTTKYWVHPDNVTEVKLIILKHLPVLVFQKNKEFDIKDCAITSIYYDNPDTWELYEGRLKKSEGAEAIRLRWYGGMEQEKIYVERKTHREDWTGEKSVKARFEIKEKLVNDYMKGAITTSAIFEKARKDGKKDAKAIDEDERLAKEVQYSVIKKGFVPVCRSFYNRTAFQLPADARVRISLDTELTMVREDNMDGRSRSGNNWRRMDIGIDFPFSQLPAEDVERFPYAVLEVKLQTQAGQEPPEWILELIASHLVEAVPKFSKFIHGCATMFPSRIDLLPFWMPQMDVDIRKPVNRQFGIQRPGHSLSTSDDDDDDSDEEDAYDASAETTVAGSSETYGQGRVHRDFENRAPGNEYDIEEVVAAEPLEQDDYPIYESDDEDAENDAIEEARRTGGWPYYSKVIKKHANLVGDRVINALHSIHRAGTSTMPRSSALAPLRNDQIQSTRFKAPKGKKIHVPVRVEPKVYFAAERTFLSWLEFSLIIGSIAVGLLNFGEKPSRISFLAAGSFGLTAIIALLYSVGIYLYRSRAIRNRKAIKYYDKVGPTVLCITIFLAVAMNAIFELSARGYISWLHVGPNVGGGRKGKW